MYFVYLKKNLILKYFKSYREIRKIVDRVPIYLTSRFLLQSHVNEQKLIH